MAKRVKPDDAALPVEEDTRYVWRWTLNETRGEYEATMFDTHTGDIEPVMFNLETEKWVRARDYHVKVQGYESESSD